MNKAELDILLELVDIEIEKINFEVNEFGEHKPWSERLKSLKSIKRQLKKKNDE